MLDMWRRIALAVAALALGAGLVIATASGHPAKGGGVFVIAGVPTAIDPAISLDAADASKPRA